MSESEIDTHLVLETQIIHLGEQNEELRKENGRLRTQFEKAMKMVANLDGLTDHNKQLKDDLLAARSEKDDLLKRIEIVSRAKEELDSTLRNERQAFSESLRSEIQSRENEISRVKLMSKQVADKLQFDLEKVVRDRDEIETKLKRIEMESQKLVSSARRYFDIDFRSFDSLCEFFDRPPPSARPETKQKRSRTGNSTKDSRRIEKLQFENLKLEDEIERLAREAHNSETQHLSAMEQLKRSFQIELDDRDMKDADKDRKLANLEKQISNLKQKLSEQENKQTQVSTPPIQVPEPVIRYVKNTEEIEELEKKNSELTHELELVQEKCKRLENQVAETGNGTTFERLQNDYERQIQTSQTELEELRKLNSAKDNEILALKKELQELSELREKMAVMQTTSQAQERRVKEMASQREESMKKLHEQELLLEKLRTDLEKHKAIAERSHADVQVLLKERAEQKENKQEPVFDAEFFKSTVFEPSLLEVIDKIASMENIEPTSKLQNIYKNINQYFTEKLSECEQAHELELERIENVTGALTELLVKLSALLSIKPISLEEFLGPDGSDPLISSISDLKQNYESARKTSDWLTVFVTHFQKSFKLESTTDSLVMLSQVNDLKGVLDTQTRKLTRKTKQCRDMKQRIKALEEKLASKDSQADELSHAMQAKLEDERDKVKEMAATIRVLKRKVKSLKSEIREIQNQKSESEATLRDQQQKLVTSSSRTETELQDRVRDLTEKNNDLQAKYSAAEAKIAHLKDVVQSQQDKIRQQDVEIQSSEREARDRQQSLSSDWQTEREATKRNYESTIESLKEQCNAHRDDIVRINAQLRSVKKDKNAAKMKVAQLVSECDRLQHEIGLKNEQIERAKKLAESASKAQILSIESDWTTKFDEERAKYESEKRRLFTFIVEQFRQFFNPQETINEGTLKAVIMKVRDALGRVSETQ